jgi:CheY-like chemotaxis protein
MVPPAASGTVAPGPSILVVGDDPGVRALLCALLTDAGYGVLQAPNGQAALALTAQVRPEAVITDVQMPEMDGPTFVRQFRTMCVAPSPVIALSASPDGLTEAMAAGADATLPKPFDLNELVDLVARLLARWPPAVRAAAAPGRDEWHPPDVAGLRADAQRLLAECRTHNRQAALLRERGRARLVVLDALAVARFQRLVPMLSAGFSGPTAIPQSPRLGTGQQWRRPPVVARVPIRQAA